VNSLIENAIATVTLGSMTLNAWHHVGWPVALKLLSGKAGRVPAALAARDLPNITVVMPAYNEAGHIGAKLRNLAALDYPRDRLEIVVACDGCSDATADIARAMLREPGCDGLSARVVEHSRNRGKVAVLNGTVAMVISDVVVLTDVSAMLPADALLKAAAHFADPALGAVGGTYVIERPGSAGEAKYWKYQVAVKTGEAALGAPLGLHGAFYALRRAAWRPLPADTINDDFILPLEIFGRGWRVAYDPSIAAVELETADAAMDARRRSRIAAGNAQQIARLAWLLHPRFGGVALSFASGKALRVAAPFLIALGVLGSVALASASPFFALLAALQLAGLAGALLGGLLGATAPRALAVARYVLAGHVASARGVVRYFAGGHRGAWRRAVAS